MKVCVIDGHLGLSVCLLNVHKNMSRKKISYKFTQFLQGFSIFISVKFTLTDEYSLQYVCTKFEYII